MKNTLKSLTKLAALGAILSMQAATAETLAEKLEAKAAAGAGKHSPEIKKAFADGIKAVDTAKVVESAKQIGDLASDFTLKNAAGNDVSLNDMLKKGPVVVTWYRGGWCPYCNIALAALQAELPAIKAAGANLIAISPELPDKALTTSEKNELKFQVLSDVGSKVANDYGLLFKLTPEVEKIYGQFFDLKEFNGKDAATNMLPLAATYIIGESGLIEWSFLHHDYRKRAEPADIVKFLQGRKK